MFRIAHEKIERLRVLMATLTSETKNFGSGTGASLAHSELIDAVAVRVIHRLHEASHEASAVFVSGALTGMDSEHGGMAAI